MKARSLGGSAEKDYGFSKVEVAGILNEQYLRIDLLMERFLLIHCVIAFALAFIYSTWMITVPVAASAVLMFGLCRRALPGSFATRCIAGVSLQAFVALHIYQLHGLPEMHFFFFTAQTMMILYYDAKAFWLGTALIIIQHVSFAALTNAGYPVQFFPDTYVSTAKQFFHYSIAVGQVGVCAYWASYLRNGVLLNARQHLKLTLTNAALSDEISVRANVERELEHQATHDTVTGLANRIRFTEDVAVAAAAVREGKSPGYAVLFVDLDHFKYVNDSLGHDIGDELLVQVGRRLETVLAEHGSIARFGGDEFTALIPECLNASVATSWAAVILEAFLLPIDLNDRSISISVSAGVAIDQSGTRECVEILRDADIALYQAKTNGRRRFVAFDEAMAEKVADRVEIGTALRGAITRGELCVFYQPIVSLADGSVVCFEALARWNHPKHGTLLPERFLDIAEESGLMGQIGEWVLRAACTQITEWNDTFGAVNRLKVAVNLSDSELRDSRMTWRVKAALEIGETDPRDLIIETTENAALNGLSDSVMTLQEIRKLGCEVHLDQFATGRASLATLLQLPVTTIKIDRSFMQGLFEDRKSEEIVAALLRMAESIGLGVIVEGVETLQQADFVRERGCKLAQGFVFGRPMSAQDATELLKRGSPYVVGFERPSAAA